MNNRPFRSGQTMWRLALGPALFVMALQFSQAEAASEADTYRIVSAEEGRITTALAKKDAKALRGSVTKLGRIIEAALAKRDRGQSVGKCDMAAHSLGFVAVSAAESLAHKGEARKMLIEDAQAAAADFIKDMQACEASNGRKKGSHNGVGNALRAL